MIIVTIVCILACALASVAHGRGDALDGNPKKAWYETKWLVAGVQLAAICAAIYFIYGLHYLALISCVVGWLTWWLLQRDGDNAHATLSFIQDAPWKDSDDVWQRQLLPAAMFGGAILLGCINAMSLWPALWLPAIAIAVWGTYWLTKQFRMRYGYSEAGARWRTEIAEGVLGGIEIAGLIHAWVI